MNVAQHIISFIGGGGPNSLAIGVRMICDWTGVRRGAVYRWTYPVDRGGTGGRIPTQYQGRILREARAAGIGLMPEDFFDPADIVAVNDNQAPVPAGVTVNNTEFGPQVPMAPRVMMP